MSSPLFGGVPRRLGESLHATRNLASVDIPTPAACRILSLLRLSISFAVSFLTGNSAPREEQLEAISESLFLGCPISSATE